MVERTIEKSVKRQVRKALERSLHCFLEKPEAKKNPI